MTTFWKTIITMTATWVVGLTVFVCHLGYEVGGKTCPIVEVKGIEIVLPEREGNEIYLPEAEPYYYLKYNDCIVTPCFTEYAEGEIE